MCVFLFVPPATSASSPAGWVGSVLSSVEVSREVREKVGRWGWRGEREGERREWEDMRERRRMARMNVRVFGVVLMSSKVNACVVRVGEGCGQTSDHTNLGRGHPTRMFLFCCLLGSFLFY